MKNKSLPRKIRITVATLVFCAFILLFLDFSGVFHRWLSPLAKMQFWPAVLSHGAGVGAVVLIIAVSAVFGRWYCSCLCPLGIMQDGMNRLSELGSKKRKYRFKFSKPMNWVRYPVLAAFIVLAALGFGAVAYLIEPYSIFGRLMGSFKGISLTIGLISLATLLVIGILTVLSGRTWCTTICPVGTILGIFSRRSMFRPVFDESKCVACGLCEKACKSSCIDSKTHSVDTSRCVMCMDCLGNCSHDAIDYRFSMPVKAKADQTACGTQNSAKAGCETQGKIPGKTTDTSRRRFLTTTAVVAATAAAGQVESKARTVMAAMERKTMPQREVPVVPPGARSLKHFTDHCVACHLCVSVCPNNVLAPSTKGEYFMIPLMNFEEGFCRPECNVCSSVCPASAIMKVTPEEKTAISIGHAVYNPDNCIVLTDNVSCGNCARHCPSGAIAMVLTENGRIPNVNIDRCIGCGRCEYVCPARPVSAIYVEGNPVHRNV